MILINLINGLIIFIEDFSWKFFLVGVVRHFVLALFDGNWKISHNCVPFQFFFFYLKRRIVNLYVFLFRKMMKREGKKIFVPRRQKKNIFCFKKSFFFGGGLFFCIIYGNYFSLYEFNRNLVDLFNEPVWVEFIFFADYKK